LGKVKAEKKKLISVIDIGTSKVTTLIGELKGDGTVGLLGVGVAPSEGVKKGIVTDMDKTAESIYQSVNAAEKEAGQVMVSAIIGITGDHVAANTSRGFTKVADPSKGVSAEDMRRAVESASRLLLPPDKQVVGIVEQDFSVDGHGGIRYPQGMSGGKLEVEVQIVTAATASVQNLARCIGKLKIDIESYELASMASGEAVLNEDEKEIGTVLIDFGAGTTEVAVFRNKLLRKARVFPVGSRHIDNDIALVLCTSAREAERLKLEYGMAYVDDSVGSEPVMLEHVGGEKKAQIPRGHLCEIIYDRVFELFKLIAHDLETDMPMSLTPTGVVLTGGGSQLPGITRVAEQVLGMNVRIGKPLYTGDHADQVSGPEFSTPVGLLRIAARNAMHRTVAAGSEGFSARRMLNEATSFLRGLFNKID